tara:strand:- start:6521 stop:6745 length:225 start_codon:yes stop_codon:yes gene_type:complete
MKEKITVHIMPRQKTMTLSLRLLLNSVNEMPANKDPISIPNTIVALSIIEEGTVKPVNNPNLTRSIVVNIETNK